MFQKLVQGYKDQKEELKNTKRKLDRVERELSRQIVKSLADVPYIHVGWLYHISYLKSGTQYCINMSRLSPDGTIQQGKVRIVIPYEFVGNPSAISRLNWHDLASRETSVRLNTGYAWNLSGIGRFYLDTECIMD